jgi:YVTN family beta-propeller protein
LAIPLWAAAFPVPLDGTWATWEAESATASGPWQAVADPAANGGKYMALTDAAGSLQFAFTLDRPTTVLLKPIWWRDGERKSARRFPYPLERLPGPDALAACGNTILFTAPAAGRVGFMDDWNETALGYLDLGGYITDCVADPEAGVFYVADAAAGRIWIVGASRHRVLGQIDTPAEPWSLALQGGKLYVACRAARCIAIIDTAQRQVIAKIATEAMPIGLETDPKEPFHLIMRFQQSVIDARDLSLSQPDRQQFGVGGPRRLVRREDGKTWVIARPGTVQVSAKGKSGVIDVTPVTGPASDSGPAAGPETIVLAGDKLLFTAPAAWKVGVISANDDKLVKTIALRGRPGDIVTDGAKAYVTCRSSNRVFVIDLVKLAVTATIEMPARPDALELVGGVALQRDYIVPPMPIDKLFVSLPEAKSVAVVDTKTGKCVKTVALGITPRRAKLAPTADSGWWPLLADDRIHFALTPRLAVEPMPAALDLASGALSPAPNAAEAALRHSAAETTIAAARKTFAASDELLVRVDDKRDVDVSAICDPQLAADRPLTAGERGSLTVSCDGGSEYNWRRDIWQRPDNGVFLVNDTDEFWRWNAPRLRLGPGRHTLTVRAAGGCVNLDAIAVTASPESAISAEVRPEPWKLHSQVPLTSYQGVFYNREPVRFSLRLANQAAEGRHVRVTGVLRNYMDEPVASITPVEVDLAPGRHSEAPIALSPTDTGRFQLVLTVASEDGTMTKDIRFVRLPKLEHPRMFFREEDIPAIRARIAQHPQLFRRYADWLARMSDKEGRFPDRFLPPEITKAGLAKFAPPDSQYPGDEWGWRMYELAFRALACEFAAEFIPGPNQEKLAAKVKPLLEKPNTDYWCQFHHHGPFFPGAVETLMDMAPPEARTNSKLWTQLSTAQGDVNVLPWTIVSLEEPVTPRERALVYKIATLHSNFERYFQTHSGTRGGTLWQNPWSWCYCPTQGIFLSFLYERNLFGESRIFDKSFFRGYLTFMEYADPITDRDKLLPALRRPSGEPWRWILTAVTKHPLEKMEYRWDDWVGKLDGALPQPEQKAVDELMALKGMPFTGPLCAAPHHFTTGVAVPMALALGWYDPQAPTVKWDEMPPTTVLNVEGWVPMRSGWDSHATEVQFMSGTRDHTARHQQNHFTIVKSGHFLIGTPALWEDDGNCTPAWGNTVVAGDKWLERWQLNLEPPRQDENALIDRFSPMTWTYITRDRRMFDWRPAESGWGGGMDLHGHSETLFANEGRLIAYETHPQYDYVAGDAGNAWPTDEMRQHFRQIVFFKPDTVLIYDRVKLGPKCSDSRWLACTGPGLSVDGQQFLIRTWPTALAGRVLLPRDAALATPKPPPYFKWKGQRLLEVRAPGSGPWVEYLVVMKTGDGDADPPAATVEDTGSTLTVKLIVNGSPVQLRLDRQGPVGGHISLIEDGRTQGRSLVDKVEDTYANWSADPRFNKWTTESRFDFVIPPGDRKR